MHCTNSRNANLKESKRDDKIIKISRIRIIEAIYND